MVHRIAQTFPKKIIDGSTECGNSPIPPNAFGKSCHIGETDVKGHQNRIDPQNDQAEQPRGSKKIPRAMFSTSFHQFYEMLLAIIVILNGWVS
jgi:hypothetical protein